MSNDQLQSIMALVVSFGNGRATNAMNHATDGPASDYVNTATQLQALESAIRESIAAPGVAQGWVPASGMTTERAAYFMRRFKHEEKLLGPNEQAAVDFVLDMLEPSPTAEQPLKEQPHG